jgi:hypothetical protein
MSIELQGQLLARERELDSREGAITAWKDGLVAFERTLGKVLTEHDVGCVRAECHTPVLESTEPKPPYVCPGSLITCMAII